MGDTGSALLLAALERLLRDRDAGRLLELHAYQALFPTLKAELADQYAKISQDDDEGLRRIGRYRLVEEIGRGGQGVVFRAVDDELGRTVALKLLTGLNALSRDALRRFLREAQATSRLDHPGICAVYEYGQDDGVPFLAMAFVEGRSLADLIAERVERGSTPGSQDVDELLDLFECAARALHAAHKTGVVHRDVKPANFMITPAGQPVLLDFGIARILEEDAPTLTRSGDVMGTPAYMAPEELSGQERRPDPRTDVYALGVSLFEALTLQRPFKAPTPAGLHQKIIAEPAPDIARLNPHVPKDVRIIIETALQKDPNDRYSSAADLADDLGRARRRETILAKAPSLLARLANWAARNPGWVASAAVIGMLLTVGTVAVSVLALRAGDALTEWERLADSARLDELFAQAEGPLWPPGPDNLAGYEAWFAQMDGLFARREEHELALNELRRQALPYSEADQAADHTIHSLAHANLADVARLRPLKAGQPEALAELDEYERRLRDLVSQRRTWRFADPTVQLRHDTLYGLLKRLHNVGADPAEYHVTLKDMQRRRDLARHLTERLAGEDAEAWQRCIDDVADTESVYGGVALEPTPGLAPLGRDRNSGLWEFWHVASGTRPHWDGDPGGLGEIRLDASTGAEGIVLVLLPGATFQMGARRPAGAGSDGSRTEPNVDPEASRYELPVHTVTLDPFLMSKYEVTRAQWTRLRHEDPAETIRAVAGASPPSGRNPIGHVDWNECLESCRRWGLLLPTEAQWEYACRAGTTTPYSTGVGASSLHGHANMRDSEGMAAMGIQLLSPTTDDFPLDAPVGSLLPNAWGLHDMHGNMWEWCRDGFWSYGDWEHASGDGMQGPLVGVTLRVSRGGSHLVPASNARSAARHRVFPEHTGTDTGFRPSLPARVPGVGPDHGQEDA